MGAVAARPTRVAVGSLVARATLRPYATLANGFDTLARILGPERLLVAHRRRRRREPRGERDLRPRVRHRRRPRRRVARRGRRGARPRLPGVGRRHAIPRCARSPPRTPTAGTAGAAGSSGSASRRANLHGRRGALAVHGVVGWPRRAGRRRRGGRGQGRAARCGRPRDRRRPRHGGRRAARPTSTPAPSG